MIADGERLKALLEEAEYRVLLCAPFIKAKVLRTVLSVVSASVPVSVVTRWRPAEIAAGVSDLEAFEVANERPNTEFKLLDDLHAKLYLADDACLVGSANLTGRALGWAERSNIELLVPARPADSEVAYFLKRLESAEPATFAIRSEMAASAAALDLAGFYEELDMAEEGGARRLAWLPRCAAPDRLYEIYQNPETTVVVDGTKEDGLADIRDILVPSGLSPADFNAVVRDTLLLIPTFSRIISEVPHGLTDSSGVALIEESRPDLAGQDAREQWRIVRDWIAIFFQDQFEVAPESFVTRLKPRQ